MRRQDRFLNHQSQIVISHLAELLLPDPGQLPLGHSEVELDRVELQPQPRILRLGLLPELMSV